MSNDPVIQAKVEEFVNTMKLFTSVDISNAIKKDGTWVSNHEVASFLKKEMKTNSLMSNYQTETIRVMNDTRKATLYLPTGSDQFDYLDRDQSALTPLEAGLTPSSTSPTVTPSSQIQTNSPASSIGQSVSMIGKKYVITAKHRRLRIPARCVVAVGMLPGDEVDYLKFCIINGPVPTKKIFVHADGRIFMPKFYVSNSNSDVIEVYVDQDQIKFA